MLFSCCQDPIHTSDSPLASANNLLLIDLQRAPEGFKAAIRKEQGKRQKLLALAVKERSLAHGFCMPQITRKPENKTPNPLLS